PDSQLFPYTTLFRSNGLFQCKMRDVLFSLQSINYQNLCSLDFFDLLWVDRFRIRNIGKITNTETHHREPKMHYPHRKNINIFENGKFFIPDFMYMNLRNSRITLV